MATSTNSYAESLAKLAKGVADVLSVTEDINEAMASTDESVSSDAASIPSFSNITKRLARVEDTVAKFTQGGGVVETDDGTYRKISVTAVPAPPDTITALPQPAAFGIDPNWFFESLQYPRCVVRLSLKGLVDDDADRAVVDRIIVDSTQTVASGTGSVLDLYASEIKGKDITYVELLALLAAAGVKYREDKEEVKLPLTYEKYKGRFTVSAVYLQDKEGAGVSRLWYDLDTLAYSLVDENGVELDNSKTLAEGDYLRFGTSLFRAAKVIGSSVRLEDSVGYESPGTGSVLELYNEPFSDKTVNVGIGFNEIDMVFAKGVDEDYNLLSREWSNMVSFYTNDLPYEGDSNTKFSKYYADNVSDFGAAWIAQAKERQVYAYDGLQPYAPALNASDYKVVQINTQLEATLDSEAYNGLTSEIASVKSKISSLRATISANKDAMRQSSASDDRANYQNLIDTDTDSLTTYTTQEQTLVNELNTLLNESGAIGYTPKYHVRGFFGIPKPRYADEDAKTGGQSIIGFETRYRYVKTDETGVRLETYEYTDSNDGTQTGVFSDWNLTASPVLSKVYDSDAGAYVWKTESTADGTAININQVDIPIRSGEKVEFKVRSVSEAGWPYNPLKSEWSNSVVMSFPDNLTTGDSATTVLEQVKDDMTAVVLQQAMSAAGVYSHLADGDSAFRHKAANISFTNKTASDASGKETGAYDMSLQTYIELLESRIKALESK